MSSKLKLVNTLSESRLFRTKKMAGDVNINDAADLVFVHFLVLNIFNKDYDFAPLASSVAGRTMSFRNFDYFRTNGTDLYMALNRLMGKDNDIGDNEKDTKKKMWDKPIVKAGTGLAAIVGLHKGASELGKRLGKTTYTTQKGKLGRKFNS